MEKDSEFEVQAEMYSALRRCGLSVRGEVPGYCDDFGRRHKCRFDIVVFDDRHNPLVIVECKNTNDGETKLYRGRQCRRYNTFGVPVIKCSGVGHVAEAKALVLEALNSGTGATRTCGGSGTNEFQ